MSCGIGKILFITFLILFYLWWNKIFIIINIAMARYATPNLPSNVTKVQTSYYIYIIYNKYKTSYNYLSIRKYIVLKKL